MTWWLPIALKAAVVGAAFGGLVILYERGVSSGYAKRSREIVAATERLNARLRALNAREAEIAAREQKALDAAIQEAINRVDKSAACVMTKRDIEAARGVR